MKKLTFALSLFASLGTSLAAVADDLYLGKPSYGGNGCPAGSVAAALSPDKKTVSVIFDKYIVEAGTPTGRTLDRKTCNVAVPIHVPAGISVTLYKIDYRGFNALPKLARSLFSAEYFFAGQQGQTSERAFKGPLQSNYLITDVVPGALVVPCGGMDTNLRANTSLTVNTNPQREQAMSTLDTADIKGGLKFHLKLQQCPPASPSETDSNFSFESEDELLNSRQGLES